MQQTVQSLIQQSTAWCFITKNKYKQTVDKKDTIARGVVASAHAQAL